MYKKMAYDRLSFDTDIYSYVSPQSKEVIHVARNHHLEELYKINTDFEFLIPLIKESLSYPIIISTFDKQESLMMIKVSKEQDTDIKAVIGTYLAPSFQSKQFEYKSTIIDTYTLSNQRQLCIANHRGVLAFSCNHRVIQNFIDSDPEQTFFTPMLGRETVYRIIHNSSISYFLPLHNEYLAMDCKVYASDSIILNGYILLDKNQTNLEDSIPDILPNLILPTRYEMDTITYCETSIPTGIKIRLNKSCE